MEFLIGIILLFVFWFIFMLLLNGLMNFFRSLFRLPQRGRNELRWHRAEDFIFGKPLNRYERRERKGRLKNW